MIKNILKIVIILIISVVIGNMAYGMYKEMQLNDGPQNILRIEDNKENIENNSLKLEKEEIPNSYKGYAVSSKLTIPKIELETYVFEDYNEETMVLCPTKYFGPEPNEEGNYCIAAHNYDKENMFNHIIELETGDEIYLTDNKNGKIKYEVYDVYKVKPTQNIALSQKTNGKTEITLITCSDYSSKRIIVKARRL